MNKLDWLEKSIVAISGGLILLLTLFTATGQFSSSRQWGYLSEPEALYQQPEEFSKIVEMLQDTVFEISCGARSSGSAWSIRMSDAKGIERSYLVTNFHVVEECLDGRAIYASNGRHPRFHVDLISFDGSYWSDKKKNENKFVDLALLQTTKELRGLKLSKDDPRLGHWLMVAGYPGDSRKRAIESLASGRLTGIDDDGLLMTDASINNGNSGGPLLNKWGEVVGTVFATEDLTEFENMGFAQPLRFHCDVIFDCKSGVPSLRQRIPDVQRFEK